MKRCKYQINSKYCVEGLICEKNKCEYYIPHKVWLPQQILHDLTKSEKDLLYQYLLQNKT